MLTRVSADFRFEPGDFATLILRADGASKGVAVTEDTAVDALIEMADWFVGTGGHKAGRMSRHLASVANPADWDEAEDRQDVLSLDPGAAIGGWIAGVPFGGTTARALRHLIEVTASPHIRVTPWRMLFLEDARAVDVDGFLSAPGDPVLDVAACPGAPACAQAEVATRDIARALAGKVRSLHVSGCPKGCARQAASEVTLVGRGGRFDLVRNGRAGDTPERTGLTGTEVQEMFA